MNRPPLPTPVLFNDVYLNSPGIIFAANLA
jgi:hypothetical protein